MTDWDQHKGPPLDPEKLVTPPGGTGISSPPRTPVVAGQDVDLRPNEADRINKFLWFCFESLTASPRVVTVSGEATRPIAVMADQYDQVLKELKWAVECLSQISGLRDIELVPCPPCNGTGIKHGGETLPGLGRLCSKCSGNGKVLRKDL